MSKRVPGAGPAEPGASQAVLDSEPLGDQEEAVLAEQHRGLDPLIGRRHQVRQLHEARRRRRALGEIAEAHIVLEDDEARAVGQEDELLGVAVALAREGPSVGVAHRLDAAVAHVEERAGVVLDEVELGEITLVGDARSVALRRDRESREPTEAAIARSQLERTAKDERAERGPGGRVLGERQGEARDHRLATRSAGEGDDQRGKEREEVQGEGGLPRSGMARNTARVTTRRCCRNDRY